LCHFTQSKVDKDGKIREYPTVEGDRDPENIQHWYWQFTYKVKNDWGKFVTQTQTVPRRKVTTVRSLIEQNTSIQGVLEYLRSSD
jgi:hypothetical protein